MLYVLTYYYSEIQNLKIVAGINLSYDRTVTIYEVFTINFFNPNISA
jgi:hypothetical protein